MLNNVASTQIEKVAIHAYTPFHFSRIFPLNVKFFQFSRQVQKQKCAQLRTDKNKKYFKLRNNEQFSLAFLSLLQTNFKRVTCRIVNATLQILLLVLVQNCRAKFFIIKTINITFMKNDKDDYFHFKEFSKIKIVLSNDRSQYVHH